MREWSRDIELNTDGCILLTQQIRFYFQKTSILFCILHIQWRRQSSRSSRIPSLRDCTSNFNITQKKFVHTEVFKPKCLFHLWATSTCQSLLYCQFCQMFRTYRAALRCAHSAITSQCNQTEYILSPPPKKKKQE